MQQSVTISPLAENDSTRTRPWDRSAVAPIAFLGLLWFMLCRHLSSEWSVNEQYSYGWFVPFFGAYLFWLRWEDRPLGAAGLDGSAAQGSGAEAGTLKHQNRPQPDLGSRIADRGMEKKSEVLNPTFNIAVAALTLIALLLLLPIRLFEIGNPDWRPLGWIHASIVVGLTLGVIWRVGGIRWLKHFAFPVCFILVAVPWISAVEFPIIQGLMRVVAAMAAETLNLLGIPAQLEGNLIRVNTGLVGVNEACSGVRSLQTSLMIGLLFGELKRLSTLRRMALVAGALGIALVANFGRAFTLVWISATDSSEAADRWHDGLGYAIVGLVFAGSMALAAALGRKAEARTEKVEDGARAKNQPRSVNALFRVPKAAFVVALVWLLAVEAGAEMWYRSHERDLIGAARWTAKKPETAGLREMDIDEGVRRTLRFDEGWQVSWPLAALSGVRPPSCLTYFFRWNAGGSSVLRARAHSPEICLPDAGWQKIGDFGTADYDVAGVRLPFRQTTFRQQRGTAIAHTFFCLQEDQRRRNEERPDLQPYTGVQPDWSFPSRLRVVRNGVRNLGQQVLEVVIVTDKEVERPIVEQKFRDVLQTIVEPPKPRA